VWERAPEIGWLSAHDLAALRYGRDPSESDVRGVRRAIARLAAQGLVERQELYGSVRARLPLTPAERRAEERTAARWERKRGRLWRAAVAEGRRLVG
jgi:hypothetical protein